MAEMTHKPAAELALPQPSMSDVLRGPQLDTTGFQNQLEAASNRVESRDGVCYTPEKRSELGLQEMKNTPTVSAWDGKQHLPPALEWSREGGGYDKAMAPWKVFNGLFGGFAGARPAAPPAWRPTWQ